MLRWFGAVLRDTKGSHLQLPRFPLIFILVLALGVLSGCDTAEERAEKHYQSALSLLEEGDQDRALVELRNVFKLNGQHRDARATYASIQQERGNIREAIGQYLRLVEQYPEDMEGQRALASMNLDVGNWPEAERHVSAALALDPEDATSRAVRVVLDYGKALEANDSVNLAKAVAEAKKIKDTVPENLAIRRVIIDDYARASDFSAALEEIDSAISLDPENKDLIGLKISALAALGDEEAVEAQLIDLVTIFPEDEEARATLVRWYLSRGQLDEAESFMRSGISEDDPDHSGQLALIRFLSELRGNDVAIAELDKIFAAGQGTPVLSALRAGLVFDEGNQQDAIESMRAILEGLEPSDEQRSIKIALARMLIAEGSNVGARSLVEEVLLEDSGNIEALKLKSNWLIDDDKTGEAIISLRTALEQDPSDAEVLSLMARAYDREGNQELVGEMLLLAYDASNRAPNEAIRYAQYLTNREKIVTAETVLIDSLRLAPNDVSILSALGSLYVETEDWARAEQVAATLIDVGTEESVGLGQGLTAQILQAQQKTGEAVSYLEGLVARGEAGLGANVEIVRSLLSEGDTAGAQAKVAEMVAQEPDNPEVKFIQAAVDQATGNNDRAEATYRDLLETQDSKSEIWVALYRLYDSEGRTDEARGAIEQALTDSPNDPTIQWIYAGIAEKSGDIDKAIEIYQSMYDQDSDNQIIANNLASLLADHRTDEDSLAKAFTIAKRLRSSDVPPFQDTYGWIAHLRGETNEALLSLESAAESLPDDPMVQYHLAQVYLKADQDDDALAQFRKVLDLTTAADTRAFVETSRIEANRIQSESDTGD